MWYRSYGQAGKEVSRNSYILYEFDRKRWSVRSVCSIVRGVPGTLAVLLANNMLCSREMANIVNARTKLQGIKGTDRHSQAWLINYYRCIFDIR